MQSKSSLFSQKDIDPLGQYEQINPPNNFNNVRRTNSSQNSMRSQRRKSWNMKIEYLCLILLILLVSIFLWYCYTPLKLKFYSLIGSNISEKFNRTKESIFGGNDHQKEGYCGKDYSS